jgi:hypothetical protein
MVIFGKTVNRYKLAKQTNRSESELGKIIDLYNKPRPLRLGDRKENFNKRLEPIQRKKQEIEQMKKSIKRGK